MVFSRIESCGESILDSGKRRRRLRGGASVAPKEGLDASGAGSALEVFDAGGGSWGSAALGVVDLAVAELGSLGREVGG